MSALLLMCDTAVMTLLGVTVARQQGGRAGWAGVRSGALLAASDGTGWSWAPLYDVMVPWPWRVPRLLVLRRCVTSFKRCCTFSATREERVRLLVKYNIHTLSASVTKIADSIGQIAVMKAIIFVSYFCIVFLCICLPCYRHVTFATFLCVLRVRFLY